MVPWNIMFAIMAFIGFILFSLLTVTFGVFGLGVGFSIVCVFLFFATALIATNWLLLPTPKEGGERKERELNLN